MAKAVTQSVKAEPVKRRVHYRCFLLRCQCQESAEVGVPAELDGEPEGSTASSWRFTVQEAGPDAARRSFTSLQDVKAYIEARLRLSGERAAGRAE